jgi:hypothetical protein
MGLAMAIKLCLIFAITILLGMSTIMRAQEQRSQEAGSPATLSDVTDLSPGQAIVTYQKGELTIKARAAPLLEVLRRVCKQVGAKIETPGGGSELISVDLGPGPPREILTSMLTGSRFNYVMQATDDPNVLARVILAPMSDSREAPEADPVLEANTAGDPPPSEETADPRESVAQIRNLVADAKRDIATFDSETDPSIRDGAAKLIGMLESSIATLPADLPQASQSNAQSSPPPQQESDSPTAIQPIHHRRR